MSRFKELAAFAAHIARMSVPEDAGGSDEAIEARIADMGDEALCGEAHALWELVRMARALASRGGA